MNFKTSFFRGLSKLNKLLLPNYSKKGLSLEKATKFQLAIIGWKYWVTKNAAINPNQEVSEN
ncbi:SsrA-binding protein [Mesonia sp. K7]|uniref:SsrA-binding protein n=1 Tax=Mesonia sp. K7 TaxID=2218606 RepID=UPI000DA71F19|nr:SsrA-binding protein [Mesonia sp. K7]PZD79648.1 SsrA-binding protein [Mesonia sp. K7]